MDETPTIKPPAKRTALWRLRDKLKNIASAGNGYCEARASEALEILDEIENIHPVDTEVQHG